MTEFRLRMVLNVGFYLPPGPVIVPYLLTGSADGQQAAQLIHIKQSLLELPDELLPVLFHPFAVGDIIDAR